MAFIQMRLLPLLISWLSLVSSVALAQTSAGNGIPQARAMRAPSNEAVRLDGRLDDPIWGTTPALTEFVQKEPNEGSRPTEEMEIRFVYDANALFVGARMYNKAGPAAIQAPLGRRDQVDQAEYVLVALDTYLDKRTAYCFGVTASGVRLDHYHSSDSENDTDDGFDPVWEARTQIDELGWSAELWIPFSQLRFNESPRADLGIEHPPQHAGSERGRLLGTDPSHRARVGFSVRAVDGHRQHQPSEENRAHSLLRRRINPDWTAGQAESVRRWIESDGKCRTRRTGGHRPEPDPRRDDQSRFRSGRGRPCRSQSLELRNVLRRAPAVFYDGQSAVLWGA